VNVYKGTRIVEKIISRKKFLTIFLGQKNIHYKKLCWKDLTINLQQTFLPKVGRRIWGMEMCDSLSCTTYFVLTSLGFYVIWKIILIKCTIFPSSPKYSSNKNDKFYKNINNPICQALINKEKKIVKNPLFLTSNIFQIKINISLTVRENMCMLLRNLVRLFRES